MTTEAASSPARDWLPGRRIVVQGTPATFRGLNPKVPGDYWVEFDHGGGWWSYHPDDVVDGTAS